MKNFKKVLALALAMMMVLSTMTTAFAATANDAEAVVLNQLGLFKGTSTTEFVPDLDKATDAAQALVLIGRALGWEVDEAATVTFTDVPDYAVPYVAYAVTAGITNGVSETEFGTSVISGKRMVTWFLAAAGYDKAAVWADTETYAAEAGMTIPTGTLRDDVVAVIYAGLSVKTVGKTTTIIEDLVAADPTLEDAAVAAGLVEAVKAVVTDAVALDNTVVDVTLEEAVKNAPAAAGFMIKTGTTEIAVSSTSLRDGGTTVRLTTAALTANTLYTLTFDGVEVKFVGVADDATAPKLSSAVATTNTEVKLTFDEKVDENALSIANYSIDGLSVLKAEYDVDADGNAVKTVVILTTSAQTQGTIYKVVVTTVTDLVGNVINADNDEYQFGGLAADETKPQLSSAVATTNTEVTLTFNESVDEATAENIANYAIDGLSVLKAERQTDKKVVVLTTSAQTQGTIYKVVVTNVTDVAGNVLNADNDEYQFGGLAPDTTKPQLSSAVGLSSTSVQVTFNENVDEATAEDIANYAIAGLTVVKAERQTDKKVVKLTTSAQTQGTIYKVIVTNVTDVAGNVINADNDEYQFGGMAADSTKPQVVSAVALTGTTVAVTFSEALDSTSATKAYNYYFGSELGYGTSVSKSTVTTDGTVWDVTTATQASKVYTLDVTGVTDVAGNVLDEDNDTATFGGMGAADATAPKVSSAVAINNNTISVTFNEALDDTTVAVGDFTITVNSGTETSAVVLAGGTFEAVSVSSDKKTVVLQAATETMTAGVVYKVTVATVDDAAGNTIGATDNTALFAGTGNANAAPKVSSVVLTDSQTMKIKFSEPVTVTGFVPGDVVITAGYAGAAIDNEVLSTDKTELTVYWDTAFVAGTIYEITVAATHVKDELNLVALDTASSANVKTFAGITGTPTAPKISAVVAVDVNTVDVVFDQEVTSTLAIGADIVLEDASGTPVVNAEALVRTEGDDGNRIRIFFPTNLTAGSLYSIVLNEAKVVNVFGTAMAAADNEKSFAAVSTANAAPKLVSAVAVSATTVKLTFSEDVTGVTTGGVGPFEFASDAETVVSVSDNGDTDAKTWLVTTDGAAAAGDVVEMSISAGILDEAGIGAADTSVKVSYVSK